MAKYLIGQLFDEEEIKEKTAFHNMKAKDEKGHMRWQGAFTGGFTAGYKNTCGSKQGWTPSTFHSSRDKRAQAQKQDIHQFMDSEDVGKSKLSQNIQINNKFKRDDQLVKIGLQSSVGQDMLNQLRKLKAQQDKPKDEQDLNKLLQKYGKKQQMQSDLYSHFVDKQDYTTLGYSWINQVQDPFIAEYSETFFQLLNDKWKEQTQEEKKKRKQDNKIYFDYTKPLQNDEHEYLKQIIDSDPGPKKKVRLNINNYQIKDLFQKQQTLKQNEKVSQYPNVPKDYDPYKKMKQYSEAKGLKKDTQDQHSHKLTIQQRKKLLGQRNPLVFKQQLQKDYLKGEQQQLGGNFEMEYYLMDPQKQKRYQEYVLQQEGKFLASDDVGGLEWEKMQQQRELFQKIYKKSMQKGNTARNAVLQAEKKKPKTQIKQIHSIVGKADRTKKQWRPEKLLCKRFNVLMPYTNK